MARLRKALLEHYRAWGAVVEILTVLVGLPRLASAAPFEVQRFRPESLEEAFRRTWPEGERPEWERPSWELPPVVPNHLVPPEQEIWQQQGIPISLQAREILGPSPQPFRHALKRQFDGKLLDRKGVETTLRNLGVTVHAAPHRPVVLWPKGWHPELHSEFEAVFPLLQKIEYRNEIVGGVNGLRRVGTFDGHKQLAKHLRKSYGRTAKEAKELAATFDHLALVHEYQAGTGGLPLLRLYGGTSGKKGRWFFCCLDRPDALGTALPIGNTMDRMATVTVPSGTRILVGVVADQKDPTMRPGGGNTQFFIPDGLPVPDSAYLDYEIAQIEHPKSPDDLLVARDDGSTVRFRPVRQSVRPETVPTIVPKVRSLFSLSPLGAATATGK